MALNKEPRNVDFYIQSKPWTEEELRELSEIIKKSKVAKPSVKRRKKATLKRVGK